MAQIALSMILRNSSCHWTKYYIMQKKKIFIYGKHGKRTPFAYPEYRQKFLHYFEYVDHPEQAEYLITGFSFDFHDNVEEVFSLLKSNQALKLVVFSEEPLWDTLWSGDFQKPKGQIKSKVDGEEVRLDYHVLNHFTSNIFEFENIPYFITTSNDYYVRYANLFSRNAKLNAIDFKKIWKCAHVRYAFFAEKRVEKTYNASHNNGSITGLSIYRSLLAMQLELDGAIRKGVGWGDGLKRQALPDWHLDKLATLDGQSFIVSALENTHFSNYITEKLFDAFAAKAIPLYYAHPNHDVFRLAEEGSFINLAGLSVEESLEKIDSFAINKEFTDKYLSSQVRLAKLFSDTKLYHDERNRVVLETIKAFSEF